MLSFGVGLLLSALATAHGMSVNVEQWLALTSEDPSTFTTCGGAEYYGTYNSRNPFSIFKTDFQGIHNLDADNIVYTNDDPRYHSLVWVEQVEAEGPLRDSEPDFATSLERFINPAPLQNDQEVLGSQVQPRRKVLYQSEQGAILSVPTKDIPTLDMYLPRLWELVKIPSEPLPKPQVDKSSDARLKWIIKHSHFDPDVASVLSGLSIAQMSFDIRWLTGELTDSPIVSRHSFSDGARTAAKWLKGKFEEFGATCDFMEFLDGFSPNVICRYAARPTGPETLEKKQPRMILGAHYDSRGTFGSVAAPGADDDGSGITQLLAIARAIHRKGVTFGVDVELVAFAGEEQGLLGSNAYAKKLYDDDEDIVLMIQADMLAYHDSSEPIQLGLPESIGSPLGAELVTKMASIYAQELSVGITKACCSDHQSFWMYGFQSTQVFERAGGIIDPYYHNSGDVSNRTNYDLEQVHAIAKVTLATLLHSTQFSMSI